MSRRVVALAGGTGSAKLLRGLAHLGRNLTVVSNVGDNAWLYGLYVCPDIDIVTYTLARIEDSGRGWGIEGDTQFVLNQIGALGERTWFNLGDRDLAVCMARTLRMARGESLTEATSAICSRLGVKQRVLPATDDSVETRVITPRGEMHLQEFWVERRGRPKVLGVRYAGAETASPSSEVEAAIRAADRILICPANPVTSIGPILAIRVFTDMLNESRGKVTALSPMIGNAPVSGPARKLLKGCGIGTDVVGVAGLYQEFVDSMIIDRRDVKSKQKIEDMGIDCRISDIIIRGPADARRLARELMVA